MRRFGSLRVQDFSNFCWCGPGAEKMQPSQGSRFYARSWAAFTVGDLSAANSITVKLIRLFKLGKYIKRPIFCDAVFLNSSPSSSQRFSLLTAWNKIKSRRFTLDLRQSRFRGGIRFYLFIFNYFIDFSMPWAWHGKQTLEPMQCENTTPHVPVRSRIRW